MKDKINMFILLLFSFVIGGLAMYYFNSNQGVSYEYTENGELACKSCNSTVIVENGSLSAAIEKIYDAVVMVRNYSNNTTIQSTGSGFVYKIDNKYAYILTNHHVVSGGKKWTVITSEDKEIEGTVLGSDAYLDLAVIKVDKKDIKAKSSIGKSSEAKLGDHVFTVGTPLGYEYRGTVTDGIISGKDRLVTVAVGDSSNSDWVMQVLQTNAAVNPGNSGGPLVNAKGEVIGIISIKLVKDSIEGMGFAIPIDYAMKFVDTLESGKAVKRPYLGIGFIDPSDTWSLYRNGIMLDKSVTYGAVIGTLEKSSPADKAKLKVGDTITKINGVKIESFAFFRYELYKYAPDETINITYIRGAKEETTKVKLGELK